LSNETREKCQFSKIFKKIDVSPSYYRTADNFGSARMESGDVEREDFNFNCRICLQSDSAYENGDCRNCGEPFFHIGYPSNEIP